MKECIILAGGLGTRLQSVVKDVPKCMAEVAGKPFLYYIFEYLEDKKINHVILSLGYKSEIIIECLSELKYTFNISYVIESEPLETGGAIKYALSKAQTNSVFVLNGDTFFDVDLSCLLSFHEVKNADISLALKPLKDFDRYGSVEIDENNKIINFKEKQFCEHGLINGGIYVVNKSYINGLNLPERFSFEKDVLETNLSEKRIYGYEVDSYFIDIGIPDDFAKANIDFLKLRND